MKMRSQIFVPLDYFSDCCIKRRPMNRFCPPQAQPYVVNRAMRMQLLQHPEALLGRGDGLVSRNSLVPSHGQFVVPTATAAAYCGSKATSHTTHRPASEASGRVAINARISLGSIDTSNWWRGNERPSPFALIYASLRVQHRKNAVRKSSSFSLPRFSHSRGEKKR